MNMPGGSQKCEWLLPGIFVFGLMVGEIHDKYKVLSRIFSCAKIIL